MGTRISKSKKTPRPPYALKDFDREHILATYFGFTPIKTPEINKEDQSKLKIVKDSYYDLPHRIENYPHSPDVLEKTAILRAYLNWNLVSEPHPVQLVYRKPLSGSGHNRGSEYILGLDIIGSTQSSAEGIIIKTALSILSGEGYDDLCINVNCLGDKDSTGDYERMLGNYIRKNISSFSTELKKSVKNDIFEIVRDTDPKNEKFRDEAPKSISFLSENSRNHFKEVLEYIESFGVPYTIKPSLIASPSFCSHTIFEIFTENEKGEKKVLASGFRYSKLSKKLGFKKELPCISATISFKKRSAGGLVRTIPKTKFYLIQLGVPAKIKSLEVIELLRKAKIAIAHSLAKDKLQSQLGSAENMKVPYVLIIGQKEALENSVTVRDMSTRVQETVGLNNLVQYLKKLK